MARLIDADKLAELCDIMADKCDAPGASESIWHQFRTTVEWSPTVDAVEVVRCRDCKHYINHDKRCGALNHGMKENEYCARGERRREMKEQINEETEEFKTIKEEWQKQAASIKTPDELKRFAKHLFDDYEHDYGTVVHAIAELALAAAYLGAKKGGITGFQAGCVMWRFICEWMYRSNKCGLKIVDYDDMLYPQYRDKFDKTISAETWETLQTEAKELLKKENAFGSVREHWANIVAGQVPFGYKIKD